jgi:ABC-type transport system involved in cytochrome bd biosynthesis fused ATPase/permease subunit
MKIKNTATAFISMFAKGAVWSLAAALGTILGYLFTTKVGGALLLVISGWMVTNITGATPTQHIWDYIYQNPAEAPAVLLEFYFG